MVKSPCVRNCCLDQKDVCVGCFRNVDEIIKWQGLDDDGKLKVLELASKRKLRSGKTGPNV